MNGAFLSDSDDDSDDDAVFGRFDEDDFITLAGYGESDDDRWENESEAASGRPGWPRFKAATPARRPAGAGAVPIHKIGRIAGGTVQTAGGKSAVKFPNPPATAASVERLQSDFKKALDAVRKDIRDLDGRIERNTATLDKKINAVDERVIKLRKEMRASQEQAQMSSLLPMLLTSAPKIENVTFAAAPVAGANVVTESTFKKTDNLLPLLLMSGGLGGGGGGSGGMNPMILALAFMRP